MFRIFAVFLFLQFSLLAQSPSGVNAHAPVQLWEDGALVEIPTLFSSIHGSDRVQVIRLGKDGKPQTMSLPKAPDGGHELGYGEHRQTVIVGKGTGERFGLDLMEYQEGHGWSTTPLEIHPTVDTPTLLLPTGMDDIYLGLNPQAAQGFIADDRSASLFSWWRRTPENKIVFFELLQFYHDGKKVFTSTAGSWPVRIVPEKSGLGRFLDYPIRAADRWVFITTSGAIWIAKDGDFSPKFLSIYSLDEKFLKDGMKFRDVLFDSSSAAWKWAVMGAQPTPDGKVLIAIRQKEALLEANRILNSQRGAVSEDDEVDRMTSQDGDLSFKLWPELHWYELDPVDGQLEKVAPENAPAQVPSWKNRARFAFKFAADGTLKFARTQKEAPPKIDSAEPKQQKNATLPTMLLDHHSKPVVDPLPNR